MAIKADFTDQEWDLVSDAPFFAGMSVVMADYSIASVQKEIAVLTEAYDEAKAHYSDNELIQAILSERTLHDSDDMDRTIMNPDYFLGKLDEITRIVEKRAGQEECTECKIFLYEIAMKVAKASGEGFLGLGKKVSERESDFLARLKETLAISFDS